MIIRFQLFFKCLQFFYNDEFLFFQKLYLFIRVLDYPLTICFGFFYILYFHRKFLVFLVIWTIRFHLRIQTPSPSWFNEIPFLPLRFNRVLNHNIFIEWDQLKFSRLRKFLGTKLDPLSLAEDDLVPIFQRMLLSLQMVRHTCLLQVYHNKF